MEIKGVLEALSDNYSYQILSLLIVTCYGHKILFILILACNNKKKHFVIEINCSNSFLLYCVFHLSYRRNWIKVKNSFQA